MSEKDLNKKAYEQAEQEMLDMRVKEIKGYVLSTLEAIESKKKDKEKIEEELRVLKLDLEDLRSGKFEKIEERLTKSDLARHVSAIRIIHLHSSAPMLNPIYTTGDFWSNATAGTYNLNNGSMFYF